MSPLHRLAPHFTTALACVSQMQCQEPRQVEVYKLPEGFRGFVLIKYGFPDATPLKVVNGAIEFQVPQNGVLSVSGYSSGGWVVPKFYRGSASDPLPWTIPGRGGWVWGGNQGGRGDDRSRSYQIYFIGPESEYLEQVNDKAKGLEAFLERHW